jgi:hypothetical protein
MGRSIQKPLDWLSQYKSRQLCTPVSSNTQSLSKFRLLLNPTTCSSRLWLASLSLLDSEPSCYLKHPSVLFPLPSSASWTSATKLQESHDASTREASKYNSLSKERIELWNSNAGELWGKCDRAMAGWRRDATRRVVVFRIWCLIRRHRIWTHRPQTRPLMWYYHIIHKRENCILLSRWISKGLGFVDRYQCLSKSNDFTSWKVGWASQTE